MSKNAREIYRANCLNLRNKGLSIVEVADFLEITTRTVYNIENNYETGGLEKALKDDPRPGTPVRLDEGVKSHVVAVVCSNPPEGFDRWTLELIRENLLEQKRVDAISTESIRMILKEHDLKPWQQQSWCVPELDEAFIESMEDVLEVYNRKLDTEYPLVCLDEKPIQLLEDKRPASGLTPGHCRRQDFEYKRKGTCNVFMAIEPKQGRYIAEVSKQRTAKHFADFMESLERKYQQAKKIVLVMDNLNTHREKSLIKKFGKEQAKKLWERFEVHYTPVHGSWLNQAELAINLYARQCLGKSRIPNVEILKKKNQSLAALHQ